MLAPHPAKGKGKHVTSDEEEETLNRIFDFPPELRQALALVHDRNNNQATTDTDGNSNGPKAAGPEGHGGA